MTDDDAYLNALYTMGVILWLTPLLLALPGFLYAVITHTNFGVDAGVFAISSMMASGFIAMLYASYKTYRKARGSETRDAKTIRA